MSAPTLVMASKFISQTDAEALAGAIGNISSARMRLPKPAEIKTAKPMTCALRVRFEKNWACIAPREFIRSPINQFHGLGTRNEFISS